MLKKCLAILGLSALALSPHAHAQTQTRKIAGYECMMLNVTEQQSMDPKFHIWVKAKPSASSQTLGWQPAIAIVKEPAVPVNGYLEILRANGQHAWIEAGILKPYHAEADPTATCAPWILPNGRIGSGPG
jgi:hypothetical protein